VRNEHLPFFFCECRDTDKWAKDELKLKSSCLVQLKKMNVGNISTKREKKLKIENIFSLVNIALNGA